LTALKDDAKMTKYSVKLNIVAFLSVVLIFSILSCAEEPEYENPLDERNLRTAGSPRGLTLTPGDAQVVVRFNGTGFEGGIQKYNIYRMFTGDAATFEKIGEIEFKRDPATGKEQQQYVFVDNKGLKNDQIDEFGVPYHYIYRITYVDTNGEETPNPDSPPSPDDKPLKIWPEAKATPSVPPEPPEITIRSQDLKVILSWESYKHPNDIAGYRIYQVRGQEFVLLDDTNAKFYRDTKFNNDNSTKKYKVVAYDEFGVESRSGVITGESPNLPPSSGPDTEVQYLVDLFFNPNSYDVIIKWEWKRGKEPTDLDGYRVYSSQTDGTWKLTADHKKTNNTYKKREQFLLIDEFMPAVRYYHVVAYDNTPKEDGKKDESPLPPMPNPPYREVLGF